MGPCFSYGGAGSWNAAGRGVGEGVAVGVGPGFVGAGVEVFAGLGLSIGVAEVGSVAWEMGVGMAPTGLSDIRM